MPDWKSSMQQTFEYYVVDPVSLKDIRRLDNVKTSTISWDSESETRGSATIDITESVGECYIRIYLVTIQNGIKEKTPLGTFLVQTPTSNFNGKIRNVSMDAYTPLLELKEKLPPMGYFIPKGENVLSKVGELTKVNVRVPVALTKGNRNLYKDEVAEPNETWMSYLSRLVGIDKHHFEIDELGRILFAPEQDIDSLQPIWTYDDGNSSILYPEISMNHDLYGIPNVVEVIYTNADEKDTRHAIAVNDDPDSPTSLQNRGRIIMHRVIDPDFHDIEDSAPDGVGASGLATAQDYANALLKKLSTIEYTVTYTHAYCPVRVGDCVRLNYKRAGLVGVKAKVISQSIKCTPGCPVSEKAVFTTNLWG